MELELLYGILAVGLVVGIIFLSALCSELRNENKYHLGRIKYLEDILKRK